MLGMMYVFSFERDIIAEPPRSVRRLLPIAQVTQLNYLPQERIVMPREMGGCGQCKARFS